jgi:hypothetical protein
VKCQHAKKYYFCSPFACQVVVAVVLVVVYSAVAFVVVIFAAIDAVDYVEILMHPFKRSVFTHSKIIFYFYFIINT